MDLLLLLLNRLYRRLAKLRRIYSFVVMKSKLIDNTLVISDGCIVPAGEWITD